RQRYDGLRGLDAAKHLTGACWEGLRHVRVKRRGGWPLEQAFVWRAGGRSKQRGIDPGIARLHAAGISRIEDVDAIVLGGRPGVDPEVAQRSGNGRECLRIVPGARPERRIGEVLQPDDARRGTTRWWGSGLPFQRTWRRRNWRRSDN